jgi:hypothetical protein
MHRLIATLSAVCLIGVVVGCEHTAGICDCSPWAWGCGGCCGNTGVAPTMYGCCPGLGGPIVPVSAVLVPTAPEGAPAAIPEQMPPPKVKEKEKDKEPPMGINGPNGPNF